MGYEAVRNRNEMERRRRQKIAEESRISDPEELVRERELTTEEAAEFLGMTVSALQCYCDRREIPFYKRGKYRVFFEKEIAAWYRRILVPVR